VSDRASDVRILFVCIGNSGRSQMSEAFVRMHGRGRIEPHSAGTRPSGRIDSMATAEMKERGYDLNSHHSKSLTEIPVGEYAAVVTMGCDDACPTIPAKHRIAWQLPNPKDVPPENFDKICDQIESNVKELLAELSE
jgi:protein-tyrosine-phosphatase